MGWKTLGSACMLNKVEKAVVYNLKKHDEGQKRRKSVAPQLLINEVGLVSALIGRPDQINSSEGKN